MNSATIRYLDRVREHTETKSDYATAKVLNVTRQAVSNWRAGRGGMDDAPAIAAAQILGLDPLEVLAEIHAERSHDPVVQNFWLKLAKTHGQAASILLASALACFMYVPVSSAHSGGAPAAHDILCKKRRRHWIVLHLPKGKRRALHPPHAYISH